MSFFFGGDRRERENEEKKTSLGLKIKWHFWNYLAGTGRYLIYSTCAFYIRPNFPEQGNHRSFNQKSETLFSLCS